MTSRLQVETLGNSGPTFETRVEAVSWALGSSPELVLIADRDGCVLFRNDAAKAEWPEAATDARVASLFPLAIRPAFAALEASALQTGQAGRFEWGDHDETGTRKWFVSTLSALGDGRGGIGGYLCLSSDMTELKRSEARLRRSEQLMVDTQGVAHLGTWEWDVKEPNATWSTELYRIYGLSPDSYVPSYDRYLTLVHPDDRQMVIDATNRVFHEHIPYSHDERILRSDGSIRYLHTWAHPVLDAGGKLIRLMGVCQDITDQKLAEQQINMLNSDLERRVQERTRVIESSLRDLEAFNAMASHDLRAPLAVIQGSCTLIAHHQDHGSPLAPKVAESLARIQRATTQMAALVNDLLTLAHVGHGSLARERIDLAPLCQDIVSQLRRGAPGREVTVQVQPALHCDADPILMRTALENLIGNAWKYTSRKENARIEVGELDRDGRRIFFVRDNGAGFDMKEAHRLFVPFQRLHSTDEFEGTGVGLAAVHRIIGRHGGSVWAEAEPGRGAALFFDVPAIA